MNIFAIGGNEETGEIDWKASAEQIDDARVHKMMVETCQILSTVLNGQGIQAPYKSLNPNHPSNLWAAESSSNFESLVEYGNHLVSEYQKRYGPKYREVETNFWIIKQLYKRDKFDNHESTPLKLAINIPECIVPNNPVKSYRNFWKTKNLRYRKSEPPTWLFD